MTVATSKSVRSTLARKAFKTFVLPAGMPATRKQSAPGLAWRGASLGLPAGELRDLIRHIDRGIPFTALTTLAANTGLSTEELSAQLGIPARTLARRKRSGIFDPRESEKLLSLATVFEKAVELFNGQTAEAVTWLRQPKKALGGETPFDYIRTEVGAREVENLIGRLQHGVFA